VRAGQQGNRQSIRLIQVLDIALTKYGSDDESDVCFLY